MNTFIIFFVAYGSAIAFANAIPVLPGCSDDNDNNNQKIEANLDEVKDAVDKQQAGNLLMFLLKGVVSGLVAGQLKLPKYLVDNINSELNDPCSSLTEKLARIAIKTFKETAAESSIIDLTALDPEQSEIIEKGVNEALRLSNQDAKNANLNDLLDFTVKGLVGLVTQYYINLIESALKGADKGSFQALVSSLEEGGKNSTLGFLKAIYT